MDELIVKKWIYLKRFRRKKLTAIESWVTDYLNNYRMADMIGTAAYRKWRREEVIYFGD